MTTTSRNQKDLTRSKAGAVQKALLALAHERGPGIKLPTMRELCQALDVARGTLERALSPLERQGILYRKHGSGIYVADNISQKTIGVIFGGDIFRPSYSPFWGLLLQAAKEQAGSHGFVPRSYLDIAGDSRGLGGRDQLVEDLEEQRLDGLLLFTPHCTYDHAGQLRRYGIPMVSIADLDSAAMPSPKWDDEFIRLAAGELAAVRASRIGLLGPPARRPALENQMHQANIPHVVVADWSYETWASIIPNAHTREICAHTLTKGMIAARPTIPLPAALVSLDDTMTRGAITALHQAGLQPGRDIRIISLGNRGSPVLEPYADSITIIEIDPADFIAVMFERLDTLVNGTPLPPVPAAIVPRLRPAATGSTDKLPLAAILEKLEPSGGRGEPALIAAQR